MFKKKSRSTGGWYTYIIQLFTSQSLHSVKYVTSDIFNTLKDGQCNIQLYMIDFFLTKLKCKSKTVKQILQTFLRCTAYYSIAKKFNMKQLDSINANAMKPFMNENYGYRYVKIVFCNI